MPRPTPSKTYPADLSEREVEVLRHLAQGLTYAQIAEQLVISRRTVNGHVTSIYSKLGVASRINHQIRAQTFRFICFRCRSRKRRHLATPFVGKLQRQMPETADPEWDRLWDQAVDQLVELHRTGRLDRWMRRELETLLAPRRA